MTGYKHRSVQKLSELYEKHKKEMGTGFGMMTMMWRAISPQIPDILKGLDDNEEMLAKIKVFLDEVAVAMTEDAKKVAGKLKHFEDKIEGEKDGSS